MKENPENYYNIQCYSRQKCMHCQDCVAFAFKYFKNTMNDKEENNTRLKNLVKKFINSTVASENLSCKYALSSEELKPYLKLLFEGKAKYPICHYEFLPK